MAVSRDEYLLGKTEVKSILDIFDTIQLNLSLDSNPYLHTITDIPSNLESVSKYRVYTIAIGYELSKSEPFSVDPDHLTELNFSIDKDI